MERGCSSLARPFPAAFLTWGMAEQHEITFAAGLASQGMTPVAAIYSTFLQRAYDQIIHDVGLLQVKVVFAIDRAGPGARRRRDPPGDLRSRFSEARWAFPLTRPPTMPSCAIGCCGLLRPDRTGPQAIRYPRGGEVKALASYGCTGRGLRFPAGPRRGQGRTGQLRQRGGRRAGGGQPAGRAQDRMQRLQACKDIIPLQRGFCTI